MPANCDGCGSTLTFCHAFSCRKEGLVTQCHNEIHDALGDLVAMGYKAALESQLYMRLMTQQSPALIADFSVQREWQPQTVAFLRPFHT